MTLFSYAQASLTSVGWALKPAHTVVAGEAFQNSCMASCLLLRHDANRVTNLLLFCFIE